MDQISPEQSSIGWIGTGIMGVPMCGHLLRAGYRVFVFNRTEEKAGELLDEGAVWCDSPIEVAREADVIFTIVGYPDDVREVYFGSKGLLAEPASGRVFIDMTTTEPTLAREIYEKALGSGCFSLDAPVSGGDVGAVRGELSIMVGGDEEVFDSIKPLLALLGGNIVYQGKAGSGQHAKMCNQITVAGVMIGICENLIYCKKAGLDPRTHASLGGKRCGLELASKQPGPKNHGWGLRPGFFC